MARRSRPRRHVRHVRKSGRSIATGNPQAPAPIVNLARALSTVAHQLPNPMDESTDYFRSFTAPLAAGTKLEAAAFQQALHVGRRYRIDFLSADDFFSNAGDADNLGEDTARGFRLLEKVMHATLTDLSVAFARADGVVRVRMWLFGRSEDGWLVGLRSTITET
jgi:hypothetical protein